MALSLGVGFETLRKGRIVSEQLFISSLADISRTEIQYSVKKFIRLLWC